MKVLELWRYPVKSMVGEKLASCRIGARGIFGDRGWAVRDEKAAEIRGAKKLYDLLLCSARYVGEPGEHATPAAEITLPDGSRVRSDDASAAAKLSEVLRRPVTLWPKQPAEATEHYRRGAPDTADMMGEMRAVFGRTEEEPLPDFSLFPAEIMEFTSPRGTYFDLFDLLLISTATLAQLKEHNPAADFDVRRFRPNIVVDTAALKGFAENDWCGRTLRLGGVRLRALIPCVRCVMPTLPQAGGVTKDPSVLRTVVREANQNVGIGLEVVTPGEVKVGDQVEIE